jgi:hypothetical protein
MNMTMFSSIPLYLSYTIHSTQISPFLYVGMYSSIFFFRRDAIVMSVRATIEEHTTTYMDCEQADTVMCYHDTNR